jgi:hypothetical protein
MAAHGDPAPLSAGDAGARALPAVAGRRKFVRPLFEDLMKTDWGKAEAKRIYAAARPGYHAVTTQTLDGIVK